MNSELLKVIEAEAEAEQQRILTAARAQAGEIIKEAEAEVQRRREQFDRSCLEEEKAVRIKAESAANLKASALRLETKSAVLDSVFDRARERLRSLSGSGYRTALGALIQEAAAGFDTSFTLRLRKDDVTAAREIIKELKLDAKAEADDSVQDGVVARDQGSRLMVYNRFSDRLDRARPALLSRLSEILWG
ncbi:MAG: V-type ATP synthase subunit E [Candidatus Edwardsbacteria bacterium]|nr:V-type ATP synthase subunit E [Candidatus Edwardsbacteria bacterium]